MINTTEEHHKSPIDVVILWVDGNDEKHQEKMLPYLDDKKQLTSKKFRTKFDQVNEIKFTIDSILKFAPFIRNIFIITDNQTPAFLRKKNANEYYQKVFVVDHNVIFSGYEEFLPTFNCRPIETCIYRIPELAEHFIYFNDDFFLINPTKPEDFFIDGLPVLRGEWKRINKKEESKKRVSHKIAQQKAAKLLGFGKYYKFRHTPHPLRKSTFENFFVSNQDIFIENIKYRFRSEHQFTPQGLANHIEIKNKTCFFKSEFDLMYFRSYKKPLLWYRLKLNLMTKNKLFLGMQSLDTCPPATLDYILKWLERRVS